MLKVAVVVMGVLIVAGIVGLVVIVVGRVSVPARVATAPSLLDEPAGTSLAAVALSGDRLVLQLRGGGPDRVVVFDLRSGGTPVRIGLAR